MEEDKNKKRPNLDKIIDLIHAQVYQPGFIYALCIMMMNDLFMPVEDYAEADWWDKLSYQELSFLFGILIKKKLDLSVLPSEADARKYMENTYKLLKELHDYYGLVSFDAMLGAALENKKQKLPPDRSNMLNSPEAIIESVFYSDSGAYDFQYSESAKERYKKDNAWIVEHCGFSIDDAVVFSKQVKELAQNKGNNRKGIKDFSALCRWTLDLFSFKISDVHLEQELVKSLLSRFSVTPGSPTNESLRYPSNFNELEVKPIIQLSNSQFLLPIAFNLARSVDESPYYWISESDKEYVVTAQKNRGDYAEESAQKLLETVFAKENVFRDVKVSRKKDEVGRKKKGEIYTDIDVLAILGNKALVIQAKSKKMTLLSRQGDLEKVGSDFKNAIQEAYDQGLEARRHILAKDALFLDKDGKEIKLDESIDEAFIIIVTTDNYPALEFQLQTLLKKSSTDPFSIAVSIFDLELLTRYLPDPFDFMFYVNQRIKLADRIFGTTEIAALGFHLDQRLYIDPKRGYDRLHIADGFAQLIDDDIMREMYGDEEMKKKSRIRQKWKNDNFTKLLSQVKASGKPGLTDAVFFLSSLSSQTADDLVKYMEDAKQKSKIDHKPHTLAMPLDSNNGITYVVAYEGRHNLQKHLLTYSVARKYKSNANEWLGLGSYADSPNIIDAVVYSKEIWEKDEELETLSKKIIHPGQMIAKKIGRNEPCYCGSGRKYKKCHYLIK